jgi:hypothetical protein
MRLGSAFWGRWSTTTQAYVTRRSIRLLDMSCGDMTNIALVPFCPVLLLLVTMTHAAKIFPECSHSNFRSIGIVHEALVTPYELPGCGVNPGHCIMLIVDRWGRMWV